MTHQLLHALGLKLSNPGMYSACAGWSDSIGGLAWLSCNPSSGEPIAEISLCSRADYERLVEEARRAFQAWRTVSPAERGQVVRRVGEALRRRREPLATLISLETGKLRRDAETELDEVVAIADRAATLAERLDELTASPQGTETRPYEQWHPLGPVGIITGFNVPLDAWARKAFPAAVCGDVTIWKPSRKAALCSLAVQHAIAEASAEAGFPGLFSWFVPENGRILDRFTRDAGVPLIAFSGSSDAGRAVSVKVADRLGRSLLELPGNHAVVVDESAEIDAVLASVLPGALVMAGQHPATIRRLIVHESRHEETAARLAAAYRALAIGNPLAPDTDLGPLIGADAVAAFRSSLEQAQWEGGDLLQGGECLEQPGHFVSPALLRAENHWDSVQRASRLPILYLIPFRDFDEAIALQNGVTEPFSSMLFTEDPIHVARYLSAEGSAGGIANVNLGFECPELAEGPWRWENPPLELLKPFMQRRTGRVDWGGQTSWSGEARTKPPSRRKARAGTRQSPDD